LGLITSIISHEGGSWTFLLPKTIDFSMFSAY